MYTYSPPNHQTGDIDYGVKNSRRVGTAGIECCRDIRFSLLYIHDSWLVICYVV